jgi:hypothetical protein
MSRRRFGSIERASAWVVQGQGVAVPKIGGIYNPGTDISLGSDTTIEVKRRATRFARLYNWLNDRGVLIGKAGRQESLMVVGLSLAAEIAKRMV